MVFTFEDIGKEKCTGESNMLEFNHFNNANDYDFLPDKTPMRVNLTKQNTPDPDECTKTRLVHEIKDLNDLNKLRSLLILLIEENELLRRAIIEVSEKTDCLGENLEEDHCRLIDVMNVLTRTYVYEDSELVKLKKRCEALKVSLTK